MRGERSRSFRGICKPDAQSTQSTDVVSDKKEIEKKIGEKNKRKKESSAKTK